MGSGSLSMKRSMVFAQYTIKVATKLSLLGGEDTAQEYMFCLYSKYSKLNPVTGFSSVGSSGLSGGTTNLGGKLNEG
jgi:hypothetical protein